MVVKVSLWWLPLMLVLVLLFSQKEREKNGWFFVYKVKERGKADFQRLIMEFFFW